MTEVGCERGVITVRSDKEPAVKALVADVVGVRAAAGAQRMNVEHSPKYSHQSSGIVERAVHVVRARCG